MSVGIIQIGQCGNQIGLNIFTNLLEEMKNSSEYISQLIADAYFTISKFRLYALNWITSSLAHNQLFPCASSLLSPLHFYALEKNYFLGSNFSSLHFSTSPPSSPFPTPSSPWSPYICPLCLYFCFANRFIYTIFLDYTYMHYYTILFFSF